MLRLTLLFLLAAALPAHAGSLWEAFGFSAPKQSAGKKRTMTFARHGLTEETVFTQCADVKDCPQAVCEQMLTRISDSLDRLPPALRTTKLPMVFWEERAEDQRPTGKMDPSFGISLRTSRDEKDFDAFLLHETAHSYDYQNEDRVSAYQKLRCATREMSTAEARFFQHLNKTNPGIDSWSQAELDEEAVRMLARMKVPRRHDKDFTALIDGYEYWAVSVEVYAKHRGDAAALGRNFSKEEAAFLERLFRP